MRGNWTSTLREAIARSKRARGIVVEEHFEEAPLRATLSQRLVLVVALVCVVLQPSLALAHATRTLAADLVTRHPPSVFLGPSLQEPIDRKLWDMYAGSNDDDDALPPILALSPRGCALTALPASPEATTQFVLSVSGCNPVPTSYAWTGQNIAAGTTTTGGSLTVTAPASAGSYAYTVVARRSGVPSPPVSINVSVLQSPPPTFTTFDTAPVAVGIGNLVPVTFSGTGYTSAQYFYGNVATTLNNTQGNTRYLNAPTTGEGVYLVRVRLSNASGSTESTRLAAVAQSPNPDPRTAPAGNVDVGTIAGSFGVADSGAASYTIPIQVPPGTAGMQPSLALSYNSQGSDGLLGVGWGVSGLSTIHRCPSTIAQDGKRDGINYDADVDNDNFCLDGQRLRPIAVLEYFPANDPDMPGKPKRVEYRTEIDTYSKIVSYVELQATYRSPTRFQVWTKSGQVLGFGSRFWVQSLGWDQRQLWAPRVNTIKVWPIDRIQDRIGNFIDIHYEGQGTLDTQQTRMDGVAAASPPEVIGALPWTETYPTRIRYYPAGTPITGPYNEVVFTYRDRDPAARIRAYDSGAGLTVLNKALERIYTYVDSGNGFPGTPVKTYKLEYQSASASASSGRMRLQSVEECTADTVTCLPKTRFVWSDIGQSFVASILSGGPGDGSDRTKLLDMNGDGRTDFARITGAGVNFAEVCLSQSSGTTAAFACSNWTLPGRTVPTLFDEIFADFNGDGIGDVAILNAAGTGSFVCYTNSAGTAFASCKDAGAIPVRSSNIRLWGDVDGNGQIDLMHYEGNGYWTACLSNPTGAAGFACQTNLPGPMGGVGDEVQNHVFLGDFNGDGRADIIARKSDSSSSDQWKVCYSSFTAPGVGGWLCPPATTWAEAAGGALDRLSVLDFNGDGLADMAARDTSGPLGANSWRVCLSAGDGSFEYRTTDNPPDPLTERRCRYWYGPDKDVNDVQFGDFNGDGRTDLAVYRQNGQWEIYRSTGTTSGFLSTGQVTVGFDPPSMGAVVAGDFNGDGRTDLAYLYNGVWRVALTSGAGDLLTRVTTGMDAETVVTYAPLTDASVYTKSPNPTLNAAELLIQSPLYVVSRTDATTAVPGSFYRTEYLYRDLKGHSQGRGLLGFRQREVLENMTWTSAGGTNSDKRTRTVVTYDHSQPWPRAGQPILVEKFAKVSPSSEVKVSETATTWDTFTGIPGLPGVTQLFQVQTVERQWELAGGELPARTTSTPRSSIDYYGNVGQIVVSVDNHVRTTTNWYGQDDPSRWILGRLTRTEVSNRLPDNTTKKRTAAFVYNVADTGANNCVKGLLCSESIEPDESDATAKVTTSYSYDIYGNRSGATQTFFDGTLSRTTSTQYDSQGRFPTSVTNPLDHVEYRRHDPRFGGLACQLSPSGIKVLTSYDAFGRRTAETTKSFSTASDCVAANDNSANATNLNYQVAGWAWINGADKSQGYVVTTRSSGAGETRITYDNLERETKRQVQAFDGVQFAETTVAYDALGRKRWTRSSSAGNGVNHTVSAVAEYDGVNRLITETTLKPNANPDGWSVVDVYASSTVGHAVVSVVDEYGFSTSRLETSTTRTGSSGPQTTTRQTSSQGQVARVVDANGKASTFLYDHFGNLIRTRGPTNIEVNLTYDIRGRKKTLVDPNVGGPTQWTYGYNGAGELVTQTDARGWTTQSGYDRLGRISSRTEYWAYASLVTSWSYDACNPPKSIGKLCSISGPGGWSRTTDYDAYARAFRSTTVNGAAYVSHTLYDRNSRTRIVGYPASSAVDNPLNLRHEYNDDGGLTGPGAVWQVKDHFSGQAYWQTETATTGRYLDGKFWKGSTGNTLTEKTYDELGRVKSIKAASGSIQNATFTFDPIGNLTQRSDTAAGLTNETFAYDKLNRLARATTTPVGAAAYWRDYSYDDAGRILTRPELAGSCGGVPSALTYVTGTHRVACADGRNYQYDANGNVTDDGVRTYEAYTPFNLPTRIKRGGITLEYTYDGEHQRATETVVGSGATTYVNGAFFEVASSTAGAVTAWRHYVGSPEGVIAVVTRYPVQATTTRYWHKDHLGSVVAETDWGGANPQRFAYDAWGKRRLTTQLPGDPNNLGSASSQRGFTGHEHLDEVGIVHMNGRLYNPATGHFLQADPIIQDPLEPQNYNRYSYVLNNPLSYTDPSGFSFWKRWGRTILAMVAAAFMQYYLMPALLGVSSFSAMTTSQAFVTSLASGFAAGGIAGGNLQSALLGAFSAGLLYGAGSLAGLAADAESDMVARELLWGRGGLGRAALHAGVGCARTAAQGGSCRSGAMAAGFAVIAGPSLDTRNFALDMAAHAAAGGVGEVLGGGKFKNGAVTGAFGYLFNECGHTRMCGSDYTRVTASGNQVLGGTAHTEIQITGGYDYEILEGQPSLTTGKMVGRSNGANRGEAFAVDLTPPNGETMGSFALRLRSAAAKYQDNLWYALPDPRSSVDRLIGDGYNSNSYASGILRDVYGYVPSSIPTAAARSGFRLPGWNNPIPLP